MVVLWLWHQQPPEGSGLIKSTELSTAMDVGVDCRSVSVDVVDSVSEPVVDVAVVETSQLL